MKKVLFCFSFAYLLFLATLGGAVEISEKQDIAIFGLTYYSYRIPDDVLSYSDSSINHVFVNLKRFNVLGYGEYRIESQDIDDFVERIREIRAEKAKQEGTYDEKFGTVVIKGEDFDRIVNSFLVVIPSLSNYTTDLEYKELVSGSTTYLVKTYSVNIVIDLSFINIQEGTTQESIRISGSGSDPQLNKANSEAVENAISALSHRIRQIDAFKIKSGVIRVRGNTLYFELGEDIGVKPGDEYQVMTKQEIGKTGRIVELPTGLVRVKKAFPEVSEASIVIQKERITEGDQLVELPLFGARVSFFSGVMKIDIPDMNYDIFLVDDFYIPPLTSYYYISLDQKEKSYAPEVGLRVVKDLGYRFHGLFDATALLNFPLIGGLGELGVGMSLYKRRLSLQFLAQGGLLYMTTFKKSLKQAGILPFLSIDGTRIDFDQDPVMSINGVSVGAKAGIGLSYLVKPRFMLSLGLNYRLYTPIKNWRIRIEETSGGEQESVTIDGDSPNIVEAQGSEGMKRVNISGYDAVFSLTFRF